MKIGLFILLSLFCFFASAQSKNSTFNTKIDNANKVEVKTNNGVINIAAAKNVIIGKVIINESFKSPVYLIGFNQILDSSGFYVTVVTFANPGRIKTSDINVTLKFSQPFESVDWKVLAESSSLMVTGYSNSLDKKECNFYAGEMIAKDGKFSATIKSKKKPFVDIHGISGALN